MTSAHLFKQQRPAVQQGSGRSLHDAARHDERTPEPTLGDYIVVIGRRRRVLLLTVLLGVALAVCVSLAQTTLYRAEVEMLLRPTASEQLLADERGQVRTATDAERQLNNEIRLVESANVRDAVKDRYDGPLDVDRVRVYAPSSDAFDVIKLSVTASHPKQAATLVNLYADTFIDVRRSQQVDDLLATGSEIEAKLDELRDEIAVVSRPLADIDASVAAATDPAVRADLEARRTATADRLTPELAPLQRRETFYAEQLDQVQVNAELSQSGGVQVLTPAEVPSSPVSPDTSRNIVLGGLIGLLAGLVLAFALEHFDDSVGSKEESERLTGLPTLGLIPRTGDRADASGDLVSLTAPTSPAAEAYRALRTSVKFLGVDQPVRTILVTSASASEGKTTTAANLGIVLAQAGERVLLVSADLRRPRLHEVFGSPAQPGLTTLLISEAATDSAIFTLDEVPGLELMPPGASPPNPSELLDGQRARDLLNELAGIYDTVIIDSPPVLPVTDAQVLAGLADVTLLVVARGETSKRGLSRALELFEQVGAPVAGTALNLVANQRSYGGYGYRYEAYGHGDRRPRWATPAPAEQLVLHARPLIESGDSAQTAHGVGASRRRTATNAKQGAVADAT